MHRKIEFLVLRVPTEEAKKVRERHQTKFFSGKRRLDFGQMMLNSGFSKKDIYDAAKKSDNGIGELVVKAVEAKGGTKDQALLRNIEQGVLNYCRYSIQTIRNISKTYRKINAASIGLALAGLSPAFISGFSTTQQIVSGTVFCLMALAVQIPKRALKLLKESEALRVAYAIKAAVEDALDRNQRQR